MNIQKIILSKWFSYLVIGIFLVCLLFLIIPVFLCFGIINEDLALNLVSEIWGLLFTLIIFIVLLEYRDFLGRKSVEGKVKKKIGKRISGIYGQLLIFCDREKGFPAPMIHDEKAVNELKRRNLEKLSSERVQLTDVIEDLYAGNYEIALSYAQRFDSSRTNLSEIEIKYFDFMDSELQEIILNFQEYLEQLSHNFRTIRLSKRADFCIALSNLIGDIMKEIVRIRQRIDIGF